MIPYIYGRAIRLHMDSGKMIQPRGAMIHDPSGRDWPKCSLLIVPVGRSRVRKATDEEYEGAPKHYLGRDHNPKVVQVTFPSSSTAEWKRIGELRRIDYVRGGTKAPGGYKHHINKPRGVYRVTHLLRGGDQPVVVSKLGSAYRLDLPNGCIIDDRGIVYP